jgi:predicted dehydrogenase
LAVFIEKPMASNSLEAAQLQQAARSAGVLLQIGLVLRYEESHTLLREEVALGHFGELVSIRVKRNCSRHWASKYLDRCPTVFETLIHDIDLMIWFSSSRAQIVMAMEHLEWLNQAGTFQPMPPKMLSLMIGMAP